MKKIIVAGCLAITTLSSYGITPLWLRDVKISPDGSNIAFCYKGDIYKVPVNGGKALQLTTQSSYESTPIWSNDGKKIAFASDRDGGNDVFIMDADGGSAKKLSQNSANELPSTFSKDDNYIYFTASLQDPAKSALFPTSSLTELYKVPVNGGRTVQVLATPAEMANLSSDGNSLIYQDNKGFENEWRKHHTSSITRDIWLYDAKNKVHKNLTAHAGEDRNPSFSPDNKGIYFLSERNNGSMNVYYLALDNANEVKPVTSFQKNPVRFLSVAPNGTLCYTYDGEIYTQGTNGKAQKLNIDLINDDKDDIAEINIGGNSTSATVSPDGKQVAFIERGEVFVTSADYTTTKQITHTPQAEEGLSFGTDNRILAYATERDGNWQIVIAKIERKDDPNFPNATIINEEVLLPSKDIERAYPKFSPDGKELAFIQDRKKLMVYNFATKKVRQVTDGLTWYSTSGGFDYSWSPDGKWFTLEFIGNKHDPYSDIGLVSAQGGSITNLTNSGYTSESPRWVLDGNAILFLTERYGMRNHASWGSLSDVMLVFLNKDAYRKFSMSKEDYELLKEVEKVKTPSKASGDDKKKSNKNKKKKSDEKSDKDSTKSIIIELDNIEDRIVRLTPNSSDLCDAVVSKDGEKLYYLSSFEKGYDMWKIDLRKKDTKLLHKMNSGWASIEMDKDGKNLFLLGKGNMQKMDLSSETLKSITASAKLKMDLAKEREYMFNHIYKEENKRFYNVNMHGVDWNAVTDTYRKFLPHINNNYDFSEMLSELLGELNVSHTGSGYRKSNSSNITANLGVLYDLSYNGKGMKIEEVIEKGPFDTSVSKVKAGDIIERIDGMEIDENSDISSFLTDKARKKTLVSLYNPSTNKRWEEVILPISSGAFSDLLYKRWVKQRAADVDRLSNGRLGYVHIESMGDDSFRSVYSDILGKYNDREGIVIDTRFNGGGRLHEDIEILFSGKKYFTQVVRGNEACDMPSRRWNKPSIMLQCEANYSNAHGTPWVYKNQGIGKLVGMPVPGTMTSVNWETLQDPTLYFGIPVTGYRLPDGSYLENKQLEPDVKVLNRPEKIVNGEDEQLKAAVDELLKEIDSKK